MTCTAAGHAHLAALAPRPERVALCYHGLDLERFSPPPPRPPAGDGSDPRRPVVLLSVGRAVAKKGYDDLLAALALLPADLAWRLVHIGGGSLAPSLRSLAASLGLAPRIEWRGALTQPEVLDAYRRADLFVLAAKITADGDRDGLPNVLIEAQSQRLACVATNISGIPELIEDGATGLLVAPGDPPALARALAELIGDPARRAALGAAGERRVRSAFAMTAGIDLLAARFGLEPVDPRSAPRPAPAAPRNSPPRNSPRRTSRRRAMRIAFYAPLKPPDHPVPSGDRRVAQLLLAALRRAGHEPVLASRFRSFEGQGDRLPPGAAGGARATARRAISSPLPRAPRRPPRSCGSPTTSTTRRRIGSGRGSRARSAFPMSSPRPRLRPSGRAAPGMPATAPSSGRSAMPTR